MTRIIGSGDSVAAITALLFRASKKPWVLMWRTKKTIQVLKKTKWVAELTKDAFVLNGSRGSAYQVILFHGTFLLCLLGKLGPPLLAATRLF